MSVEEEAREMLKRIGWHESDWKQLEIYARMEPRQKLAEMFRLRRQHVQLLEKRLRREHPGCTDREIVQMIQEHLDLVRERVSYE